MVDFVKKQQKQEDAAVLPPTNQAAEVPARAPEPAKTSEKTKKPSTFGVKTHNEITYRGVDFFLNSMIGVAFSYWINRTKSGEERFGKPLNDFLAKRMENFSKNPATIKSGAAWGGRILTIIIGGMLIIPGMIVLENKKFKKGLVRNLDTMRFGKEEVENNPRFEEAYKEIDNEPKKDFAAGMLSRFAVLIPMIAVTMSPLNKHMENILYKPIAKITKGAAKMLGIQPKKLMKTMADDIVDGKPQKTSDWDYLHTTIGLDFGLTFIYSYLHEYAYKAFAGLEEQYFGDEKEKPREAAASFPSPSRGEGQGGGVLKQKHDTALAEAPSPTDNVIKKPRWSEKDFKKDPAKTFAAQIKSEPQPAIGERVMG